jgi:hypothetical protein
VVEFRSCEFSDYGQRYSGDGSVDHPGVVEFQAMKSGGNVETKTEPH